MKASLFSALLRGSLRSAIVAPWGGARILRRRDEGRFLAGSIAARLVAPRLAPRLAPLALAVAGLFLAEGGAGTAWGAVTVVENNGVLTDTLGATSDTSTLSTGTAGNIINASGVGTPFNGVTGIALQFQADSQIVTLDSSNFAFTPAVTVNAVAGTAGSDAIVIQGANNVTLTGTGTYGGGTTVMAGSTLNVQSGTALGTGGVNMGDGTTLIGSGTFGLTNAFTFDSDNSGTIAATNGNTLTLSGLSVDSGSTVHFGNAGNTGTIAIGAGTYTAVGGSSLEVTAGTTLQNAGGLGALASAANSTSVDAGATLDVNDQSMAITVLEGSGNVTLGKLAATNLTLGGDTFSGVISGAGGVTINSTTVTFTGANTYTGGTTITGAGIFQLSGNGSVTGTIADSGQLIFSPTSAATYGNAISGSGTVQVIGGGVALTGNSTFSGGTTVGMSDHPFSPGTLIVGSSTALGSGAVSVNNNSELIGSGAITLANVVNFIDVSGGIPTLSATPGSTLTLNSVDVTDAVNLIFGSAGHTGTVVVAGTSGTNPNATGITVAFGTLQNGGGLGTLTSAASSTTVNAGATLALNDLGLTVTDLEGSGAVTLGKMSGTLLTLGGGNFSGVISGAGQVTIAGNVTFGGANTYTGGTTINSGGALTLSGAGAVAGNVADAGTLTFAPTSTSTFAGAISGNGSINIASGVVTLTGNNSFRAISTVGPGATLVVGSATALGATEFILSNGSELRGAFSSIALNANPLVFAAGTANATISTGPGDTLSTASMDTTNLTTLTFGSAGHTGTVNFGIGGGVSDPSNANVTVAFGTLQNGGLLSVLTSASGAVTTVNPGATLDLNDRNLIVDNLKAGGSVTLDNLPATNLTLNESTFRGVISGAGSVTITGEYHPQRREHLHRRHPREQRLSHHRRFWLSRRKHHQHFRGHLQPVRRLHLRRCDRRQRLSRHRLRHRDSHREQHLQWRHHRDRRRHPHPRQFHRARHPRRHAFQRQRIARRPQHDHAGQYRELCLGHEWRHHFRAQGRHLHPVRPGCEEHLRPHLRQRGPDRHRRHRRQHQRTESPHRRPHRRLRHPAGGRRPRSHHHR